MSKFEESWNIYAKGMDEYTSYKQRFLKSLPEFLAGLIENLNWSQYSVALSRDGRSFVDFDKVWQSRSSFEGSLKPVSNGVWSIWIALELSKKGSYGHGLEPVQFAIPLFLCLVDDGIFRVLVRSDTFGEQTYDLSENNVRQSGELADYIHKAMLHKLQDGVAWDLKENKVLQPIKLWNPE
jgi:hypothetical protein